MASLGSDIPLEIRSFLIKDEHILMLRRFNTGFCDGSYGPIAGHLEGGETFTQAIIREAAEEANIRPLGMHFAHAMHRLSNDERMSLFFVATDWEGEITNNEPDKCDDISWFPLSALPSNTIPYIVAAISRYHDGLSYSEFGW